MIDTDKYAEVIDDDGYFCEDRIADLLAEVKQLREELDGREAYIKRLSEQLSRATEWAYKQYCYKQEKMDDFDDYVWGKKND